MSQSPYLLYVNTSPKGASDETWMKWWIYRHASDVIKSELCDRVALYKEIGFAMLPSPDHPQRFLALYYTDCERPQDEESYEPVSPEEDSEMRNYKLIQNYDPRRLDEGR